MALLYGKPLADKLLALIKERVTKARVAPGLAVILIGDDAPSRLYVNLKEKAAQSVGIHFEKYAFPKIVAREDIFQCIGGLNARKDIHGIVVQLPLPKGLPTDEIIARIDQRKDTDGFHPETLRKFLAGEQNECPVFPRAMITLLRSLQIRYAGEKGLVIANSEMLGKITMRALMNEGLRAEYILSQEKPEIISAKTQEARVILTACGIPNLIIGAMISEKTIVIDGGISRLDGKVVGDAERVSVEKKAGFLSPVPGGVGPVTVAVLLARVTEQALDDIKTK